MRGGEDGRNIHLQQRDLRIKKCTPTNKMNNWYGLYTQRRERKIN